MEKEQIEATLAALGNESVPLPHRAAQIVDIMGGAQGGEGASKEVAREVFKRLQNSTLDEKAQKKAMMLDIILQQVELAPMRRGTFVQTAQIDNSKLEHAMIIMDNGEVAYIVAHNQPEVKKLNMGDKVLVDAHMKLLVRPETSNIKFGEIVRFERKLDDRHIEVMTHQDMKAVLLCSVDLMEQIKKEQVMTGAQIVTGAHFSLGLYALPPVEGVSHYKFLDRGAIPDVRVDRDIGNPPRVIEQVALHIREEMTRPELRRKFRLRPCITRLLCGVSGTGKSLAIAAIHRLVYEIMSEITGTPIEQLPHRVFRIKSSSMLSMWFGESDKNIDRMFDEVEQLADQPHVNARGKSFRIPVMVVLEEADGLGRARGGDTIYDRIMTVILQRLDPNREGLSSKLAVFLSTTNEPHIVDPAFLRRIGGTVETFGRLDQRGFTSILRKHVNGLPAKDGKNKNQEKIWVNIIDSISAGMFSPEDKGVTELTYQNNQPVIKYRRDFLTGALIDRAVQQAASEAWEQSIKDDPEAGITASILWQALNNQVLNVVHQLVPDNVHKYTDLPDGVRVTRVRRIPVAETAV
jgi:ATP-dependent 26S proteasome regulatory subunit